MRRPGIHYPALLYGLVACTNDPDPSDTDSVATSADEAVSLFFQPTPIVIAHRGGRGIGPDHTLLTYQRGVDAGADVLELDVHTTSEGEVVCIHDATVDRTTDGVGRVRDFTLAEIQGLDAGYTWSPDDGATYPDRGTGHQIPTLGEVFEAFPNAWYVIEIKQSDPPMVDPFLTVLDANGMRDRTIVASFSDEVIQEVRAKAPDVLTAFGEAEATEFRLTVLDDSYEPPAEALQLPPTFLSGAIDVINDKLINDAQRFGLVVHAWTINDPPEMDRLLEVGVNGLITDWPARAREAIDALP